MRKNVIFEFNHRCQLAGEMADRFIASFYSLMENCNRPECIKVLIVVMS